MNRNRKILVAIFSLLALIGYTKLIWQSGFDQGADVSLCLVQSYIQYDGEKVAANEPSCQRAKEYQSNPLWILRRRENIE